MVRRLCSTCRPANASPSASMMAYSKCIDLGEKVRKGDVLARIWPADRTGVAPALYHAIQVAAIDVERLGDDVVDSELARKTAAPAMSCGRPMRPRERPGRPGASSRRGRFPRTAKRASTSSHIGVSITPGAIALTLMRCLMSSSPALREADHRRLCRAVDRHAASPRRPAWLEKLMILPPFPAAIIRSEMAWQVNSSPRTLILNCRSKSSSVISASGAMLKTPRR